jgi:hypothetical protein
LAAPNWFSISRTTIGKDGADIIRSKTLSALGAIPVGVFRALISGTQCPRWNGGNERERMNAQGAVLGPDLFHGVSTPFPQFHQTKLIILIAKSEIIFQVVLPTGPTYSNSISKVQPRWLRSTLGWMTTALVMRHFISSLKQERSGERGLITPFPTPVTTLNENQSVDGRYGSFSPAGSQYRFFSGNEPGVNLPTADDDIQCQDYYCRFNLARPLGGNARITEVASVAFEILHR